ncbi:MAG TPA: MerR family transcriptional regulator [Pyrinomonadaceae bacterium]|nr:MerR family transcriptional regulator [Acidobacteriota bacterium]HQZ95812.1 MerR family transcriptional regulator [Pyrinomonadaceae bacterium]
MAQEAVVIPEKIYFKIGEVCELVGVQAHVLRYWETEFSTLSPQKNKSGQRSYRRRDVEIALRIKQLLYNEMFTIAGARKKLQAEIREGSKPKEHSAPPIAQVRAQAEAPVPTVPPGVALGPTGAPLLFDAGFETELETAPTETRTPHAVQPAREYSGSEKDAIRVIAGHLLDLREMLKNSQVS